MKRLQGFILGVLVSLIVVASIPTFADSIAVVINGISITINGKKIASINQQFTLDNGSTVPYSIVYKGTTYLPMKKLAELLNKDITWDNSTKTAGIYDKGTAPVKVTSGAVTKMETYAFKINGKFYKNVQDTPFDRELYYDSNGRLYWPKATISLFSIENLYRGCLSAVDNFAEFTPSDNPILDGFFSINLMNLNYVKYEQNYEYNGLEKVLKRIWTYKSKDMSKEAILNSTNTYISLSGNGLDLFKYVTINNVEYIDVTYILNYLGFDGKAYYDTAKNINVFEVLE